MVYTFNSCIVHIIWGIQRFDIVLLFLTSRQIHVLRVFLNDLIKFQYIIQRKSGA